jgi:predicted transcriptional regulator of viral defense system
MSTINRPSGESTADVVIAELRKATVMRTKDLVALGVSRQYLSKLCRSGVIERVARGLYRLPDAEVSAHHTTVQACRRIPHGVVCLLSALRFHDVTTQAPFEVWMAIEVKARLPQADDPPLRIVRFSGPAFSEGVEEHTVEGVPVRVYSLAKTVADCFKYRNKIGLEVALEALREAVHERRIPMDELWRFATICRVANVMRPYLESLT